MRGTRISILALVMTAAATLLAAQTPEHPAAAKAGTLARYRSRLLGVFDDASGEPIEGARVLDLASGMSAATTKTGTVSLAYLSDGESLVRVQKIGYVPVTLPVAISPADTTPVTLTLKKLTELPAVVTKAMSQRWISPRLNAFEERRRVAGSGYFLTDSVLRKNDYRTLGDLVRSALPGATVAEGAGSAQFLLQSARCMSGGPPQVFLDGVVLNSPVVGGRASSTAPFNLSDFRIDELAGVEWYPDNAVAPAEFGMTSARCGVLLLWTRER